MERLAGSTYGTGTAVLEGKINEFAGRLQCLVVLPQLTEAASLRALRTALENESRADIDGVVVIADLPVAVLSGGVEAFVVSRDDPTPRFFVVDPRALLTLTADRPWVWSKHFGPTAPVKVIAPRDEEHREDVFLAGVPPEERELVRTNIHPSVIALDRAVPIGWGCTFRIVGGPGSGKTTAREQLRRRRAHGVARAV